MNLDSAKKDIKNYVPSDEQLNVANELTILCSETERAGVKMSVAGGYGLDALYGSLTRDHGDYDLLVADKDANALSEILLRKGYLLENDESTVSKHVYTKPGRKIEIGLLSAVAQALGMDESELLPDQPNGKLLGTDVYTPTIEAHKAIIAMQNLRATQESWQEYPDAKRVNQEVLLELLSET